MTANIGNIKQAKAPIFRERALIVPSTVQESEGNFSFEVSFASERSVIMWDWGIGEYNEILKMAGMRSERLNAGMPLLDSHDNYERVSEGGVLGVVTGYRVEGTQVLATIKMSNREELAGLRRDIADGIVGNVSCGYRVYKYEEQKRGAEDPLPTYVAVDWEPYEISLVSVPADPTSKVRSHTRSENSENILEISHIAIEMEDEKEKGAPAPAHNGGTPATDEATRAQIAREERERVLAIGQIGARMGLASRAQELIDNGTALDKARAILQDEWVQQDPTKEVAKTPNVRTGADEKDKRRAAVADGLMLRANPSKFAGTPADGARDFRGMDLLRLAEEVLTLEGTSTRGMTPREIAQTALNVNSRGYHSTSDFPNILADVFNKTLRRDYELTPRTFMPFCRRGSARDFKEMNKVQLSGMIGSFDEVLEGSEYKAGSAKDAVEKYKVVKYGKTLAITWESLINDDLSAFDRLPAAIAAKAAQKQSDIVYNILLNNPNMGDGVALFHADHGNLGSASAINEAGVSAARKAMRNQKDLSGSFINVMPAYMIVGNDKETEAQKLLQATIVATKTADTNIFRGYTDLIVEPRITGNKWFLAANPNAIDTIEYAFLDGEGELYTESRTGFEIDGLELKARMVFGAKAIDWRSLYYNPGA